MTASDGPQWSALVGSVSKAGEVTVRATVTEPLDHDMVLNERIYRRLFCFH